MQSTKYQRIYSDEQGESHFDEVEVTFTPVEYAPPQPPMNYVSLFPATGCHLIGGPGGGDFDEFHNAPRRQMLCMLQGQSEMRTSDGNSRIFNAGDMVLVEDTTGKGHSSRFTSKEDAVALVVALA
jgi:hypothetical protein